MPPPEPEDPVAAESNEAGSDGDLQALHAQIRALLTASGELQEAEPLEFEALPGGVSSTLLRVRAPRSDRSWCAKRPLTRLTVAGDWQVSQARSASEVAWLQTVAAWHPDAVPRVIAAAAAQHLFVMDDHAPPHWQPWKPRLLEGRIDVATGARLGALIGDIHARSAAAPELAQRFANDALFHALRVRPFLHAATEAHSDLRTELRALQADLGAGDLALVHGDVSPKNVLVHDDGRIMLLDAECACWAAPHFDAAFFLCHAMLKWAHRADLEHAWRELVLAFHDAWTDARDGRIGDPVDTRCTLLLPGLLLARVDGLSPVDYLDPERRARVRSFARTQLRARPQRLELLLQRYARAMGDID